MPGLRRWSTQDGAAAARQVHQGRHGAADLPRLRVPRARSRMDAAVGHARRGAAGGQVLGLQRDRVREPERGEQGCLLPRPSGQDGGADRPRQGGVPAAARRPGAHRRGGGGDRRRARPWASSPRPPSSSTATISRACRRGRSSRRDRVQRPRLDPSRGRAPAGGGVTPPCHGRASARAGRARRRRSSRSAAGSGPEGGRSAAGQRAIGHMPLGYGRRTMDATRRRVR